MQVTFGGYLTSAVRRFPALWARFDGDTLGDTLGKIYIVDPSRQCRCARHAV